MSYYSALAFNRQARGTSKVFVATYTDDDLEGGNSIRYLWTTTVDTGTSKLFEDPRGSFEIFNYIRPRD
jgi:hypothetical protein